jgi:predicted site-specific integrase-resolvase
MSKQDRRETMSQEKARSPLLPALMTANETAVLLGVTPGTLQIWRCTGRYKLAYVKIGGKVRYRLSDVVQFVESRVVRSGVERLAS